MGYNYNYYYYHSSIPYEPKVGLRVPLRSRVLRGFVTAFGRFGRVVFGFTALIFSGFGLRGQGPQKVWYTVSAL